MTRMLVTLRAALLCALLLPGLAWAGGFARVNVHDLQRQGECYVLNAPWQVVQSDSKLREALQHGVKLQFVQSFELERQMDWWFNKSIVTRSRQITLSYSSLVDAYRIELSETGEPDCGGGAEGSVQHFRTLPEALGFIGNLRGWRVMRHEVPQAGKTYLAALRIHLDISRLPQTLQLSALTNDRWDIDSNWQRWEWSAPPH